MSNEAHKMLSRAVLTAIRSPTREIDPEAMKLALDAGWAKDKILKAAENALNHVPVKEQTTEPAENNQETPVDEGPTETSNFEQASQYKQESTVTKPQSAFEISERSHMILSKAISSAIQSPSGEIDPQAMKDALNAGWKDAVIMKAVDVAKERYIQQQSVTTQEENSFQVKEHNRNGYMVNAEPEGSTYVHQQQKSITAPGENKSQIEGPKRNDYINDVTPKAKDYPYVYMQQQYVAKEQKGEDQEVYKYLDDDTHQQSVTAREKIQVDDNPTSEGSEYSYVPL